MKKVTTLYTSYFILICLLLTACSSESNQAKTEQNIHFNSYEIAYDKCQHLDRFESLDCMVGAQIPNFEGIALSERLISTKKLKNKVVVINFWATHCKPCIAEMPGLNDIVDLYKNKEVEFISIAGNSSADIVPFLQQHPFDFEIIPDENYALNKETFKNSWGLPLTIIFNKKGMIHKMSCGGRIDEGASEEVKNLIIPEIEKLL